MSKATPPTSIRVVQVFKNEWAFDFPRLDMRVYDVFHQSLDDFDSGRLKKAEHDLRLLVDGFPEFIDAYHHLALILDETRRHKEARRLWETAITIGRDAIPKSFRKGLHRLPWGILENRPFLRAYHSWGLRLLDEGEIDGAVAVFEEMLSMNPNDNQGIRALAIDCYFRLAQPDRVIALCKRYRNDAMEEVLYGRPLALFQLHQLPEARAALAKAVEILPLVAGELIKKAHRRPKDLSPDFITHGGADQAYYYWQRHGQFWQNTDGAMELVASALESRAR